MSPLVLALELNMYLVYCMALCEWWCLGPLWMMVLEKGVFFCEIRKLHAICSSWGRTRVHWFWYSLEKSTSKAEYNLGLWSRFKWNWLFRLTTSLTSSTRYALVCSTCALDFELVMRMYAYGRWEKVDFTPRCRIGREFIWSVCVGG